MLTPREQRFGELMYRRATGNAPEMDCARSLCRLLAAWHEPGMSLLDAGCGGAHYLASFRRHLDPGIEYHGIDDSPHYIDLARQAFPELTTLAVGRIEALPYADRQFDLVVCSNVLPNLPAPPRTAIAELVRVARVAVVIRALFADANYLIRELDTAGDDETLLIGADGEPAAGVAVHNNLYTERYLRQVIGSIDPGLRPVVEPDRPAGQFASDHPAGTRTLGAKQIAGPLLLDWRFITIPVGGAG